MVCVSELIIMSSLVFVCVYMLCMPCPHVSILMFAMCCVLHVLKFVEWLVESDAMSFEMRTRSLARRRATTVIKQEEEEVDCNTRIVQEGKAMSVFILYMYVSFRLFTHRWTRCTSGETEQQWILHGCWRHIWKTCGTTCMRRETR